LIRFQIWFILLALVAFILLAAFILVATLEPIEEVGLFALILLAVRSLDLLIRNLRQRHNTRRTKWQLLSRSKGISSVKSK
jgi:uncharacterized Tic20 family protein